MKHARISYDGQIKGAIAKNGTLQLDDGRIVSENDVIFLPPIVPETIFALGLNYADHAAELSFTAPKEPLLFLKGPNTFVGHHSQTVRPSGVTFMHYECELAVIIGKSGKQIKKTDAYKYVAGYTIANDYAIRDYLENYYRPNLRVKNRDATTPLGPWIVDKEDIKDPMNLRLRTYVNGNLVQEGTTSDMIFNIAEIIAYISSFMTLHKGDVILTGTPKGSINVDVGDEVITEIEGIGQLKNTIISENE